MGDSLLLGVSTVRKGDIMSQNKHEPKESGNRTASSAAISGELSPDAAEGAESALESYVDVLLRDDVTQAQLDVEALPEHQRALGERLAKLSNYIREGQKLAYDLAEGKIEALDPSRFDSNNPLLLSLDEIKDNLSQSLTLASAFIADSDEKQPQEVSGNYILSLNAARSLRRSFRSAMVARWPTLNAATTVGRPRLMPTGKCTTTSLRTSMRVPKRRVARIRMCLMTWIIACSKRCPWPPKAATRLCTTSTRAKNVTGKYVLCESRGYRLEGSEGMPTMYVGYIINRSAAEVTDPVTGLGNYRGLVAALGETRTRGCSVGLVAVKVNRIAEVNRKYGYEAGDHVMSEITGRIVLRLRAGVEQTGRLCHRRNLCLHLRKRA